MSTLCFARLNPLHDLFEIPRHVSTGQRDTAGKLAASLHIEDGSLGQWNHCMKFLAVNKNPSCAFHIFPLHPYDNVLEVTCCCLLRLGKRLNLVDTAGIN